MTTLEHKINYAQKIISPSFLWVYNKEKQEGKSLFRLVRSCFYADDANPSEQEVKEVRELCEDLNTAGYKGEFGVFTW